MLLSHVCSFWFGTCCHSSRLSILWSRSIDYVAWSSLCLFVHCVWRLLPACFNEGVRDETVGAACDVAADIASATSAAEARGSAPATALITGPANVGFNAAFPACRLSADCHWRGEDIGPYISLLRESAGMEFPVSSTCSPKMSSS